MDTGPLDDPLRGGGGESSSSSSSSRASSSPTSPSQRSFAPFASSPPLHHRHESNQSPRTPQQQRRPQYSDVPRPFRSPHASPSPSSQSPNRAQDRAHQRPLITLADEDGVEDNIHPGVTPVDGTGSVIVLDPSSTQIYRDHRLASHRERDDGEEDKMSTIRAYGATGGAEASGRDSRRPGRIAMPQRFTDNAEGETPANGDDTRLLGPGRPSPDLSGSPSGQGPADTNVRPRRFSFKKRRGLQTNNTASIYSDGNAPNRSGFLNRLALNFGRSGPSKLGPGGDGGGDSSDGRFGGRTRAMRRIHTVSVNGQEGAEADGADLSGWERKPRIPSLMPTGPSPNSTPIPLLPFVVLCLVCFGEFSSAGVAGPFLFFQIESFNVGGEGEVGYWAGVVAAVFFFAQFLTSMLWASVAQAHGRRAVLLVSLLGNSISLILFGMATNLPMAISVRLAQGLFNGAVGVAKGAVRDLTDETNEGRAMAQLGFAWGMGGIIGPLMGGLLCNPVDKFPWLFKDNEYLKEYPYVLPCLVVASFTATGALLTLFMGPDGGPRTGAIHLPEKVDVERATTRAASTMGSLGRNAGKRITGYFVPPESRAVGANDHQAGESLIDLRSDAGPSTSNVSNIPGIPRTFTQQVEDETGGPPSPHDSDDEGTIVTTRAGNSAFDEAGKRPFFARAPLLSRTTARQRSILGGGSAYGYERPSSVAGRSARHIPTGSASGIRTSYAPHARDQRASMLSNNAYAADFEDIGGRGANTTAKPRKLSFAQRFLLANDDAVLGLSDLWVAAAINGDEMYEDEEDDDFGYDYEGNDDNDDNNTQQETLEDEDEDVGNGLEDSFEVCDFDQSNARESTGSIAFGHDESNEDSPLMPRHLPPLNFARRYRLGSAGASSRGSRPHMQRLGSGGRIPSVYNNTGVEMPVRPMSPPAVSNGVAAGGGGVTGGYDPTLAGIPESTSVPATLHGGRAKDQQMLAEAHSRYGGINAVGSHAQKQKEPSVFLQLPLVFIAHYALMSLHSSTFDQIFMAYLVSPFKSGGLGLTAAHYAELIAAMAFCQIGFQFFFYPKVGPPQGQLSHLAMMRLGTCLYLPVYVLFAYLRAFLHPSTDVLVMSFMILFASLRLLANVCSFTAVSILMNATTAPHLVPLANGLAQTSSSAARFIGPLVGGMLWAKGVEGGYETRQWPFDYHLGFLVVGLIGFTGFMHSWLIR